MSGHLSTVAVVPVKELANVKQRLAGLLAAGERQGLFRAMVSDVLTALRDSPLVRGTWVITDDAAVGSLAEALGAECRPEPAERGLIQAVTWAGRRMAAEGVERLLFVPGDIPLLSVSDLAVMLEATPEPGAAEFAIAPARDLGGSNCITCVPPDCMEFAFGIDSFRRHIEIARRLGLQTRVMKLPGIGLDVDVPKDLQELIIRVKASNIDSHTRRYLDESGLIRRLEERIARREMAGDPDE